MAQFSIFDCETRQQVSKRRYDSADEAGHDYHMNAGRTYVGVVTDVSIDGAGFYTIAGQSRKGVRWVSKNVQGALDGTAYCDDMRMTQDIADGAIEAGLTVEVNDRRYLGDNRVEVSNA